MKEMKRALIAFRIEPEIAEQLDTYSIEHQQSRSYMIRVALMQLLKNEKPSE
jgi:predicted transcriptional regulator